MKGATERLTRWPLRAAIRGAMNVSFASVAVSALYVFAAASVSAWRDGGQWVVLTWGMAAALCFFSGLAGTWLFGLAAFDRATGHIDERCAPLGILGEWLCIAAFGGVVTLVAVTMLVRVP